MGTYTWKGHGAKVPPCRIQQECTLLRFLQLLNGGLAV